MLLSCKRRTEVRVGKSEGSRRGDPRKAAREQSIHEEHVEENPQLHSLLEAAMIGNAKTFKDLLTNKRSSMQKTRRAGRP